MSVCGRSLPKWQCTSPGATAFTKASLAKSSPWLTIVYASCRRGRDSLLESGEPKDPKAEVTYDGLRPLILLEVLLKLWFGVVIARITLACERQRVLSAAQHGVQPGRGTDTGFLQYINAVKNGEETNQPYTSPVRYSESTDSSFTDSDGAWLVPPRRPNQGGALAGVFWYGRPHGYPLPLGSAHLVPVGLRWFPTFSIHGPPCHFRQSPENSTGGHLNWVSFFDIAL